MSFEVRPDQPVIPRPVNILGAGPRGGLVNTNEASAMMYEVLEHGPFATCQHVSASVIPDDDIVLGHCRRIECPGIDRVIHLPPLLCTNFVYGFDAIRDRGMTICIV